jgi:hypothetical protein
MLKNILLNLSMVLIMLLICCSKERINGPTTKYYFDVSFSIDSIASFNGISEINYTGLLLSDSAYRITIADIKKDWNNLDGGWLFALFIPKSEYIGNGKYYLKEFIGSDTWHTKKPSIWFFKNYNIEKDSIYIIHSISFYSKTIKNQAGIIELYNVTDSTMGIKFSNILLGTQYENIIATCSCDMILKTKLIKLNK